MHFNIEAYRADDAGDSDPDPIFTTTVATLDDVHAHIAAHWPNAEYKYLFREGNVATYSVTDDGNAVAVLIVEPVL